jgi:transglutaminase-like putative cysteine protease
MDRPIRIEAAVRILSCVISAVSFLSILKYVGFSYAVAFGVLYLFSLYFEYYGSFPLPRWLLTLAAAAVIISTFFRMASDDPVVASVEALLILLAIKLLAEKRFRDHMQIYVIALFLLTGSALLSFDMEFLIYFVSLIFLVTVALVLLTYLSQDNAMKLPVSTLMKILWKTSPIPLIAIPATVFLFIILPRTSYPMLTFLNRGTIANTGFTDTVSIGKVSDIQEDTTVIFRAHMDRIDENALYWRGIVLDYFDGSSWQRTHKERPSGNRAESVPGKQIAQTIYLEPYGNRYLFALDRPSSVSARHVTRYDDLTYSLWGNISRRIRYDSLSVPSGILYDDAVDRSVYLQLPEMNFGKIGQLVKSLSSGKTKEETVQGIMRFLKGGGFQYTMEKMPASDDPLDDFLFKYNRGNCEYFASAMAVMLRLAGIPSRLVGGYRGGYYNDTGGYYLVPQKNAHVWVEAYLKGGWVRLDPTPLGIESFVSTAGKGAFFKLGLFLDTLNYYWNASVINYDFSKQLSLLRKVRSFRMPRIHLSIEKEVLKTYLPVILIGAVFIALVFLSIVLRKPGEEKILQAFLKEMGRKGYGKSRSEGLEEFASRVADVSLRERALAFVREFEGYYYRDRRIQGEELRRLKELIKKTSALRPMKD